MALRAAAFVLVLVVTVWAGCAPDAGWSEARLQAWAERRLPMGTPYDDVKTVLRREGLKFSAGTRYIHVDLANPWWAVPIAWATMVARIGGISLEFDVENRLEKIDAWLAAVGP